MHVKKTFFAILAFVLIQSCHHSALSSMDDNELAFREAEDRFWGLKKKNHHEEFAMIHESGKQEPALPVVQKPRPMTEEEEFEKMEEEVLKEKLNQKRKESMYAANPDLADAELQNFIEKTIYNLKNVMTAPLRIGKTEIPTMEPMTIDKIEFTEKDYNVVMSNDIMKGISNFKIVENKICLRKKQLLLSIHFPLIVTTGQYRLRSTTKRLFALHGDDNFRIKFKEMTLSIKTELKVTDKLYLQLSEFNIDVNVDSVRLRFYNLLKGNLMGKTIAFLIHAFGTMAFNHIKPMILANYSKLLKEQLNEALSKVDLGILFGASPRIPT